MKLIKRKGFFVWLFSLLFSTEKKLTLIDCLAECICFHDFSSFYFFSGEKKMSWNKSIHFSPWIYFFVWWLHLWRFFLSFQGLHLILDEQLLVKEKSDEWTETRAKKDNQEKRQKKEVKDRKFFVSFFVAVMVTNYISCFNELTWQWCVIGTEYFFMNIKIVSQVKDS